MLISSLSLRILSFDVKVNKGEKMWTNVCVKSSKENKCRSFKTFSWNFSIIINLLSVTRWQEEKNTAAAAEVWTKPVQRKNLFVPDFSAVADVLPGTEMLCFYVFFFPCLRKASVAQCGRRSGKYLGNNVYWDLHEKFIFIADSYSNTTA